MKKTNIYLLISIIFFSLFIISWLYLNKEPKQEEKSNYQEIVSEYIKENINDLSPRQGELGGTFYVTNLEFIDENLVIVDYEDGHIDLKAEATFSIINNEVIIDLFTILNNDNQKISDDKKVLVINYINNNISSLSPEPEVLGSTFYVTNLEFIDENLVIVDYEDGHITLRAQVIYSIIDNQVIINSFKLIEDKEEELIDDKIDEDLISQYIEENISSLSPEPEVLGGTFYVTNLEFIDENLVIVDYEDGHIALRAEASFYIENDKVVVNSFKLID